METQKKKPRKQLEKFSAIFMQLGLVLTLFVVFITLEHETEKDMAVVSEPYYEFTDPVFTFQKEIIVKKQPKAVVKPQKKQIVKRVISKPVVVENVTNTPETVIDLPVENTPVVVSKPTNVISKVDKSIEKTMSINSVQNTPVFKGCEGLSEEENRICFERKIQKHIQRYFNAEIAQDVGLRSGKYKIVTQFVIDKTGKVSDIKIRAPHKKLEKETDKVVNKIPQFTPGKQNNKPVKVKYTLPITFKVE